MPRRALSTLRAEIMEGVPWGTSMELSGSASSVPASIDDASPEHLMLRNLGGFDAKATKFRSVEPIFLGGVSGRPLWAMWSAAVEADILLVVL